MTIATPVLTSLATVVGTGTGLWLLQRLVDTERVPLDDGVRASAPGQFVALAEGQVHYQLLGPLEGPVVVLLPGATLPLFVWDPSVDALTRAGYRVLRYDLFGRGLSDRPHTAYGPELFDRQLTGLLAALHLEGSVHLVGIALGGLIALSFADRHPERVQSLTLIEPDGLGSRIPLVGRLAQAPLLGDYLSRVLGSWQMLQRLGDFSDRPEIVSGLRERFIPFLRITGFKRALLSTLRNMPIHHAEELYARIAERRPPVLLLWGRNDRVTPLEIGQRVRAALPHAEFHVIEEAGHFPHFERPEVVNPLVLEFLSRSRGGDRAADCQ